MGDDNAGPIEVEIVSRIVRYSSMRSVERALMPSVRRRRSLPTRLTGSDLFERLQKLQEQVHPSDGADSPALGGIALELQEIDRGLARFHDQLVELIDGTPIMQLRSTMPAMMARGRRDVISLLDLCLDAYDAGCEARKPFLVDYLITLLSRRTVQGVSTLVSDPCLASPGVVQRCEAGERKGDFRALEMAQHFRDAAIEILDLDDMSGIISRMRKVKIAMRETLYHRDVLRAVVTYNIAAENRFRDLFELERDQDLALSQTLEALHKLGLAEQLRLPVPPEPSGSSNELLGAPAGEAWRALEDVDDEDQPRQQAWSTLERAAAVVGSTYRDAPSLEERLRRSIVTGEERDAIWMQELDDALSLAIRTLSQAGRSKEAQQLTRTRMKYLIHD